MVGELTLRTEALALPGDPDQTLFVYLADPGSRSEEALAVLSSWAAGQSHADDRTTAPDSHQGTERRRNTAG